MTEIKRAYKKSDIDKESLYLAEIDTDNEIYTNYPPKWLKFIQNMYFEGLNQTDAYQKAYDCSRVTAKSNSSRLRATDKFKEFQDKFLKKFVGDEHLFEIKTLNNQLIKKAISQINDDSISLYDKAKIVKILNELTGHLEQQAMIDITNEKVEINFGKNGLRKPAVTSYEEMMELEERMNSEVIDVDYSE